MVSFALPAKYLVLLTSAWALRHLPTRSFSHSSGRWVKLGLSMRGVSAATVPSKRSRPEMEGITDSAGGARDDRHGTAAMVAGTSGGPGRGPRRRWGGRRDGHQAGPKAKADVDVAPAVVADGSVVPGSTPDRVAGGHGSARGSRGVRAAVPDRSASAPATKGDAGTAATRQPRIPAGVVAGVSSSPVEKDESIDGKPKADGSTAMMNSAFLSEVRWNDPEIAGMLSTPTRKAITDTFKFELMSRVQAATLPVIMRGSDVFGKAKTGSGKTLAFLIPVVELLVKQRTAKAARRGASIRSLVIAPTRELALQIEAEAQQLLTWHDNIRVVSVIGGRNINTERKRLDLSSARANVDILIATPGRMIDHMDSTPNFAEALSGILYLVLDEADRMLDMGFRPSLEKILRAIPSHGRQNLLFSATVSPTVRTMAGVVLRPDASFVDCVGADAPETNEHVRQEYLIVSSNSVMPALLRILQHIANADADHKVMVFFPTARFTGFAAALFAAVATAGGPRFRILEIHSRKSQSARTTAADTFKRNKGIIIFSSDVSARGMDFADVTHVIQVGLTDREQYIHRLGRTARAGKEGSGLLLLADFEAPLLTELKGLPLVPALADSALTGGVPNGIPAEEGAYPSIAPLPAYTSVVRNIMRTELGTEASRAYSAWLGFYNTNLKRIRWTKEVMVAEANRLFTEGFGLPEPPMMPRDTLGKMGLRGVVGIREGAKGWKPRDD